MASPSKKTVALLLLLPLLLWVGVADAEPQQVSLQLKWKHAFQFAGFYMAIEKGFYQQAGLAVGIREVSADTEVIDEVLSGRAEYGVSDSALIHARLNGKPVVALAAILQHSPIALMVLERSGITRPEQLRGKRVMMFANEKTAPLSSMLASRHLSKSDYVRLPHTFDIDSLIDGKVDAYAVYSSDQPHQLELRGIAYNLLEPRDFGFDFYGDMLFTSLQQIEAYPERTEAFYRASIDGWKYAFEHIEETIQLILERYNSQNLSAEQLRFEADALKGLSGIAEDTFGQINRVKTDSIAAIFRLLEQLPMDQTLNGFIYKEGGSYLTREEQRFIGEHEIRVITTDNWAPFNIRVGNQELAGIAIDYWDLIREKTGLRSRYIVVDAWEEVIKGIKEKSSDVTISTSLTKERREYARFSKPYASFPIAIATTNDKGFISSLSGLQDGKIAVGKGYSAHLLLKQNYPEIDLAAVENDATALEYVSTGKVFAAAEILPVLAYKIAELGYSNIKISGATDFNFDVRFMARDDLPLLISIINKGINSISDQEKRSIFNKWVAVKFSSGLDYSLVWKIGVPLLVLLLATYLWARTLKREIKRRVLAEEKLNVLATTDPLTSIPNRYKIENLLEQQFQFYNRYDRPFSIIFLDLDDFKRINDNFGHEVGDSILVEFSALVQAHIRRTDYFGRWGGEEFLILLPETTLERAGQLAEKLLLTISGHEFTHKVRLSSSIGVAEVNSADTLKSILDRADKGLYRAKNAGKNRVEILLS